MDPTEQIVHSHLVSLGYQDILYEPDGNVPPDFLVDRKIAVEVRRLNQNERGRTSPKGLEEVEMPLLGKLQRLLASFGPSKTTTWWVFFRFKRPVPRWQRIEENIREFFSSAEVALSAGKTSKWIGHNFQVEVLPKTILKDDAFELGGICDLDQGGWVLEEIDRNLRICIEEKTKKVAPFHPKYKEWWLILVDHVAYGMSNFARNMFYENVKIQHNWDRVTLIDPINPARYFNI